MWTHWGHVDHSERTWLVREGAIGSEKGPMEVNRCGAGGTGLAGEGGFADERGRVSGAAEYRVG